MDGKRIKSIRTSLKLTQKQLAKKVGISYQTISELENGKPIPDGKMALYESAFKQLEQIEKGDFIAEEKPEYRKTEILDEILGELKEIRKENEQLNETITQMQADSSSERKMNDLLRKQLQLAINVLKNLDLELNEREKSTSTKQNISKI